MKYVNTPQVIEWIDKKVVNAVLATQRQGCNF